MSREIPEQHLVLSRLFARYFGAGGPNVNVYGEEIPMTPLNGYDIQPLESIAQDLREIKESLSSIAESLVKISERE